MGTSLRLEPGTWGDAKVESKVRKSGFYLISNGELGRFSEQAVTW